MRPLRKFAPILAVAATLVAPGYAARADEGEKLVQESCGKCHNAKTRPLSGYHLTREKWKDAIERMEGMGADVPSGKKLDVVLDYLVRTHGPEGAAPDQKQ